MQCTPYQGFGELKVTEFGWEYESDDFWNQQDEAIPTKTPRRFSGRPRAYEQSHDVS